MASSHLRVTTYVISHITLAEEKWLVIMNPDSTTIGCDGIVQKPVVVNPQIRKTFVKAGFFFLALSQVSFDI